MYTTTVDTNTLDIRLLDAKAVQRITLFSASGLRSRTAEGRFPRPRYLGIKRVWYMWEVEKWMEENITDEPTHNNVRPETLEGKAHA